MDIAAGYDLGFCDMGFGMAGFKRRAENVVKRLGEVVYGFGG